MEWYRLKLEGLKSSKIRLLMMRYIEYQEIFSELELLKTDLNFTDTDLEIIIKSKDSKKYDEFKEKLKQLNISLIGINTNKYPKFLKNIEKPPLFLFCKGEIELLTSEKIISIVGTRAATKYGESCCDKIVKGLVEENVVIVSGLALGIDAIAHRKTLDYGGKTIAVLGCGVDIVYPKTNKHLREDIERRGVVISEFPLGTSSKPINFPIRNRIIAGISRGTVVIESSIKSGSLITANLAFEEGREIFAIPGDIISEFSKGCNELIKNNQAKLITSSDDILNEYGWERRKIITSVEINLSGEKLAIYNCLKTKLQLDEIKEKIKLDTSLLLSYLMELELEGYVKSLPGGYYRREEKF